MASLVRLPPAIRAGLASPSSMTLTTHSRPFHSSTSTCASILFALNALSNSRETQHFNKISHLHRTEHSPPLKLIKTSEIDPYPLPSQPKAAVIPPQQRQHASLAISAQLWDTRALNLGRAVLADHVRHAHRLTRMLERSRLREARQQQALQRAQTAWQQERAKLRNELRAAGAWILAAVGAATALAMWRFWPNAEASRDSGVMGRKIAERARAAMPLPAAGLSAPVLAASGSELAAVPAGAATVVPPAVSAAPATERVVASSESGSWWRNLFWVQQ